MRNISALQAAIAMTKTPALVRTARRAALPPGMTFLLEVAANDPEAVEIACQTTRQSLETLRAASGFFIEQILLTNNDDSYRVLAGAPDTPVSNLRRHMALLLKWLHPDVAASAAMSSEIDRSMFANRVTKAWEDLKTEERREAYARSYARKKRLKRSRKRTLQNVKPASHSINRTTVKTNNEWPKDTQSKPKAKPVRKFKRLTIHPLANDSFLSRLVLRIKGQG